MHCRPRLRRWSVCAAAGAFAVALAGCGASEVSVTAAAAAANPLCHNVIDKWPATVANQKSRAVSVTDGTAAAWGDPAVIARCGVTSPGATSDPCIPVSGIDWVGHELSDGWRFVTFGRSPAIEVLVPAKYAPEPLVLGAFTEVAKQIPQGPDRCS